MVKIEHKFPEIGDKCIGCGTCVSVCPRSVFEMNGSKAKVVRPEDCIECGACVANCPVSTIKLIEVQ